jgi:lipoate-protein ligase B
MEPVCFVQRLGIVPYQQARALEERLAADVAAGLRPPTLLLLQHPHTFTLGRRASRDHLLWDETERQRRGVELYEVDRGGDVTYHGPGQLVGYPVMRLAPPGWASARIPQADFIGYIRRLESALIVTLAGFGIAAGQIPGKTGVWVLPDALSHCRRCDPAQRSDPVKIASIGVRVDAGGVSRHGFALNVDPDPDYWQGIVPCGLEGVSMAAMSDFLDPPPAMGAVMDAITSAFGATFGLRMAEEELSPPV